jgi:putative oxidoreductase
MTADIGLFVARLMLSIVFLWSGADKLLHWSAGVAEIAAAGLPNAPLLLAATVIAQLAGGLSVALGIWARLGALALAGFTIVATLLFHAYWSAADAMEHQRQLTTFLEHVAIVGGFLAIIAVGPGTWSVGHHLRASFNGGYGRPGG